MYSGGQGVWDDRNDIAACSAVANDRVTVELVSNGGAFGGKEDMSNQAHAALAAWLLDRPVKCTLSREESFRIHAKRHPIRLEYWAGCDADGTLTALQVRGIGDSGAYASVGMKVLERAAGHASGPYRVPAIDVETIAVRTNNLVCGAFRGFGANQAQFAMEGVLDRLAEQVGISGWEIRKRNVIRPGDVWGPGQIMDDGAGGAEACLDAIKPALRRGGRRRQGGRARPRAEELRARQRVPRGVAAPSCASAPTDGRVEVRHGWTEMGQGVHTVALQVAAQELGIDPDRIDVIVDTTRELGFGQTTGSRGTLMAAGSVQRGVRRGARRRLRARTSTTTASTSSTGPRSSATRASRTRRSTPRFGYAAQMVDHRPRDRARSSGSSPCTTSARRSTRCCARARSRAACTWASATRSPRTSRPIPRPASRPT